MIVTTSWIFVRLLIVIVVLATIAALVVWAMRRGKKTRVTQPSCAICGYPAQGISTLNCPECGADLRMVGIVKPGDQSSVALGCLLIFVYSTVLCFIAFVLFIFLADQVIPARYSNENTIRFMPNSGEFYSAELNAHYSETVSAGTFPTASGLSTTHHYSSSSGSSTAVQFDGLNAAASNTQIHRIYLELTPKQSVTLKGFSPIVEINPATGGVTWTDSQGKTHPTNNSFTDQDMLVVLKDLGADTTRPQVLVEAQELDGMLDAFVAGTPQFAITTMNSAGSSSSSNYGISPPWFVPVYILSAIGLWILGIILIARRLRKGAQGKPEQNLKKY